MTSKLQNRIKIALYIVLIIAALLIQESVFGALNLRYSPCVLPVLAACIGLREGAEKGAILGLVAGCLWAWNTELSYFGAWGIVALTVSGAVTGVLSERFLLQTWKSALGMSAGALVLTEGVYVLGRSINGSMPALALFSEFLPRALIAMFFCFAFYPLTGCVSRIGGFHG